jgi:hypothetical protein
MAILLAGDGDRGLHCKHNLSFCFHVAILTDSSIYNGTIGLGLLFTYFPHAHTRAEGFSRRSILKRIDFVGGAISITGLTLL